MKFFELFSQDNLWTFFNHTKIFMDSESQAAAAKIARDWIGMND